VKIAEALVWGQITGTLSNQTDLNSRFNTYATTLAQYADDAVGGHLVTLDPHGDRAYSVQRANHTGTQAPSTILTDASNRFVTDAEKSTWNAKQNAPENEACPHIMQQLAAVRRRLIRGYSGCVLQIVTDSTGVGGNNWPAIMAETIADAQPKFNVTTQVYTSDIDGGTHTWGQKTRRWICPQGLPQINFNGIKTGVGGSGDDSLLQYPTIAATGATGNGAWEIKMEVMFPTNSIGGPSNTLPCLRHNLISRTTSDIQQRQLELEVQVTSGQLNLRWCSGTPTYTINNSVFMGQIRNFMGENEYRWIKVAYTGDAGATPRRFIISHSSNGVSYTQFYISPADLGANAPSYTANLPWVMGVFSSYNTGTFSCRGFEYWQSKTGSAVADQLIIPDNMAAWRSNLDTSSHKYPHNWNRSGAPTLDIRIGACGGANLLDFDLVTTPGSLISPQYWHSDIDVVLYGAMHNFNLYTGDSALANARQMVSGFRTYATSRAPNASLIMFTELPLGLTSTNYTPYRYDTSLRKFAVCAAYAKSLGDEVIDTMLAVQVGMTQADIDSQTLNGAGIHWDSGGGPWGTGVGGPTLVGQLLGNAISAFGRTDIT
jgi:hypothetical protein